MTTLETLTERAEPYPAHLLRQGGTGLCLFAARFYGINDAVHMAQAGMTVDVVDTSDRVLEFPGIYGDSFTAHHTDAWEFADLAFAAGREWDAVSADSYTGDAERRSLASLELWCALARDVVTATVTPHAEFSVPDGWDAEVVRRSTRANWLVLTRA